MTTSEKGKNEISQFIKDYELTFPILLDENGDIADMYQAITIPTQVGKTYEYAFVIGGLICVIGQLLFDVAKLTPGHTLSLLVVIGAVLDGFGLYEPLVDFAGAGATIPITSFGNSLVHGALQEAEQHGIVGVLTGMFEVTSSGISAAIIFGFIGALLFKPKG